MAGCLKDRNKGHRVIVSARGTICAAANNLFRERPPEAPYPMPRLRLPKGCVAAPCHADAAAACVWAASDKSRGPVAAFARGSDGVLFVLLSQLWHRALEHPFTATYVPPEAPAAASSSSSSHEMHGCIFELLYGQNSIFAVNFYTLLHTAADR
jgi:hypothetical protein